MKPLHVMLAAALAGAVVLSTHGARSFAQEGARVDDTAVSGAQACAEGKSALVSRLAERSVGSAASPNFDATYYDLDLDLDFDTPLVRGVVRVEGRVVGSALSMLVLDFSSDMQVDSVRTAAGEAVGVSHVGEVLLLALPGAVAPGAIVAVAVAYHGLPPQTDGVFEFGERDGATYAWSYSEPYDARRWWPCKDHPSDKADSVRVRVTVPDSLAVGSQGLLKSVVTGGGRSTYEWFCGYPIATYLVSVAAGEYVEHNEVYTRPPILETQFGALSLPIVHLAYDDGTSDLPPGWGRAAAALEVLEAWFGAYPFPLEKYGHAEVTFSGAMEHQTMSSMGSPSTNVVVHELAHQWFGDMVSPRTWADLWLNEGFATYAELLYWEAHDADAPGTYALLLRNTVRNATRASGTLVLEDTTSVPNMFSPTRVYAKGGIVLHMLRAVVGDVAFRDILRQYAADPEVVYGAATTADFQRVAEAVHGEALDTFFAQWVTGGTGYPDYRVDVELKTHGDYKAFVTVEQAQSFPESNVDVFEMPVTIAVSTTEGEERFTVTNDRRRQTFEFDVAAKPIGVIFDPNLQLLRDVDLSSAPPTFVARAPAFQNVYPNPAGASTVLRFTLPDDRSAELVIYDVAGRRVRALARVRGDGPHEVTVDVGGLSSGVYFVKLEGAAGSDERRLVVVR